MSRDPWSRFPRKRSRSVNGIGSAEELLQHACPENYESCKEIFQSSFPNDFFKTTNVTSSENGFVYSAYKAYSDHRHLTIRPEDVWFSILSQLNFFINAHAEELRSKFVTHRGRKELEVIGYGTRYTVDFGKLAVRMTDLMKENVLDPELQAFVMPSFSTTTDSDRVIASILMMCGLQKYFKYKMQLRCGIPGVTLLGKREDWEDILQRLEKLPVLGEEPTKFSELLKPILRRFNAWFDDPESPEVLDFWNKVAHRSGGSGTHYLSGWLTAFCFWDNDGNSMYGDGPTGPVTHENHKEDRAGCELDGVLFHRVDTDKIPSGYASVPVLVDENGRQFKTTMVAGSIGIQTTSSGKKMVRRERGSFVEVPRPDSLQPLSGWWMYEMKDKVEDENGARTHVSSRDMRKNLRHKWLMDKMKDEQADEDALFIPDCER